MSAKHNIAIDVVIDKDGAPQQINVAFDDALKPYALASAAFMLMRAADTEAEKCGCMICRRIRAKLKTIIPEGPNADGMPRGTMQ